MFVVVNLLWSLLFSSLLVFHPSHAHGRVMTSTILLAFFIPLISLFPVSVIILAVAPLTSYLISPIQSVKLSVLFITSPRYFYVSKCCNISPFNVRAPFTLITTLHLAAPYWIYLLAAWFVTLSIS